MIEFGAAELLDTGLIRPLAMGIGTRLLGRAWGIPLGKLAADITFYVPVILIYEWRRRARAQVRRFLLAFPESALARLRLTVERLIAQRGERRPRTPPV